MSQHRVVERPRTPSLCARDPTLTSLADEVAGGAGPGRDQSRRPRASARSPALACLLLIAGALGAACGDDDGDRREASCAVHDVPCDIRERDCQARVFALTACARGQRSATIPPIRVITRAQFAEETRAQLGSAVPDREDEVLSNGLRLLAFLPAGGSVGQASADADIEGVAAYYHNVDKAVTIIDDAAEDTTNGTFTLSHEFVHSLQDQREGIGALNRQLDSSDSGLALDSLLEGEATVLAQVLLAQARGRDYGAIDPLPFYDALLLDFLDDIAGSNAPLTLAMSVLPYPTGGRPLASAYKSMGSAGVDAFYRARPPTFTSWVLGRDGADLPRRLRCAPPTAPAGYASIGSDRFGGAGLLALYTRLGLDGPAAHTVAQAWTGDLITFYGPAFGPVAAAVAWRIGLRDDAAATALEERVRGASLGLDVLRSGAEVLISAATQPEVLAGWSARAECRVEKSLSEAPGQPLLPRRPFQLLRLRQRGHAD